MLRALAASCRSSNVQRAVGCGKWQASTWTSRADALKFARPRSSRTQVPGISGWSSSSDRLGSLDAAAVSRGSACYRQHVIRHFYSSAALSTQMPCAPRACLGRGLSRGVVSFRSPPAARALHYESGPRFREYQGWDGGGPTPSKFSLLLRPMLFTGAVVVGGLGLAAIYRDEQYRKQKWVFPGQRRQAVALDFMGWRFTIPQLVCGSLVLANGVIFLCWTRSLRGAQSLEAAYPWLRKYFLHHAFSGRGLPLVGSAFSHATFPHFLFNMMALYSFGTALCRDLGPENFLAWYMSAAALTSLGGMLVKLGMTCTTPSLGASGAVLFMAATTAFRFPDAQFGIIFLPFITLPAWQMMMGIVSLDCAGLLLGWRMFDHGAHLSAVACGYLFVHGGYQAGVRLQREIVLQWRKVRKSLA